MTRDEPRMPPPIEERDDRLAGLLAALTDELPRGPRRPTSNRSPASHPDLADELRELWAAAEIAEELARDVDDSDRLALDPDRARRRPARTAREGRQFGDCELLEELGRGGMGVVYRARQSGLGRVVALKRLHAGDVGVAARPSPGSAPRPRPPRGSTTRTSSRSTPSDSPGSSPIS